MTRHAITSRNALLDAAGVLCNGGVLRYYTGEQPATPETTASGEMLAELRLGTPAFKAADSGAIKAEAITGDESAAASGEAGWFRIFRADGLTAVFDGSISETGRGGQIEMNSTFIQAGARVDCDSLTITMPM